MVRHRAFKRIALGPLKAEGFTRLLLRRRHKFRRARNTRNRRNLAAISGGRFALSRNRNAQKIR